MHSLHGMMRVELIPQAVQELLGLMNSGRVQEAGTIRHRIAGNTNGRSHDLIRMRLPRGRRPVRLVVNDRRL